MPGIAAQVGRVVGLKYSVIRQKDYETDEEEDGGQILEDLEQGEIQVE